MTITALTTTKVRNYPISRSSMSRYLKNHFPRLYKQIIKQTKELDKFNVDGKKAVVSLYERLYCIEHGLLDRPLCKKCEKKYVGRFIKHENCYSKWCSSACQASDAECIEKSKKTRKEKYGDENFNNKEKRSMTIEQRCIDDPQYWEKRIRKTKATKLERHGSESYMNAEKMKQTMHQHEKEDPNFWKKREEKSMQTKMKNGHGPKWNNREKAKQTCLENYGVEWFSMSDEWKEVMAQICEDDAGFYARLAEKRNKTISEMPGFYEARQMKTSATCVDRYGVKSTLLLEKCKQNKIMSFAQQKMKYVNECEYDMPLFTVDDIVQHFHEKDYKYKFRCKKCGRTFLASLKYIFGRHYHCSRCYPRSRSRCEYAMFEYVMSIWKDKNEVLYNNRKLIPPYEVDISVISDSTKLAIEYDGLFWHSIDNNAYRPDEAIGKDYHLKKLEMCEQQGIQLLNVLEDEWVFDPNGVKGKIAHTLGLIDQVDSSQYSIKIENRKISLVGKDDNMQIMALHFSKSRFNIKEEWELLSYETSYEKTAKDGLHAMIDAFESHFHPKSMVVFVDRRWSNGKEYEKCGFSVAGTLKPQCWWFNKKTLQRIHENCFKKNYTSSLLGEKFTYDDEQIRRLNRLGWMRIYDCGQLKLTKSS